LRRDFHSSFELVCHRAVICCQVIKLYCVSLLMDTVNLSSLIWIVPNLLFRTVYTTTVM
jgi:hypothetical protein